MVQALSVDNVDTAMLQITNAIRNFVMDKSRTSPKSDAFFGINMLVQTEIGMVYTYDKIKEDLERLGFTDICHAADAPTMSAIVTVKNLADVHPRHIQALRSLGCSKEEMLYCTTYACASTLAAY